MFEIIDTHCHLEMPVFDNDREAVIQRGIQVGISTFIDPGTDLASSQKAVLLAETHPQIYAAVGLHPNDIRLNWESELKELENLVGHPRVVAIGEIGLDTYHTEVPLDLQVKVLEAQLELAAKYSLPVIIHSRETLSVITPILKKWANLLPERGEKLPCGVMHSFEGGDIEALPFIESGFFIGVAGPLTYKNAGKKILLVEKLSIDHLVLETDSPFLPPVPFRGKRNEPAFLSQIVQSAAIISGCEEDFLRNRMAINAKKLFRIGVYQ